MSAEESEIDPTRPPTRAREQITLTEVLEATNLFTHPHRQQVRKQPTMKFFFAIRSLFSEAAAIDRAVAGISRLGHPAGSCRRPGSSSPVRRHGPDREGLRGFVTRRCPRRTGPPAAFNKANDKWNAADKAADRARGIAFQSWDCHSRFDQRLMHETDSEFVGKESCPKCGSRDKVTAMASAWPVTTTGARRRAGRNPARIEH